MPDLHFTRMPNKSTASLLNWIKKIVEVKNILDGTGSAMMQMVSKGLHNQVLGKKLAAIGVDRDKSIDDFQVKEIVQKVMSITKADFDFVRQQIKAPPANVKAVATAVLLIINKKKP